MTDTRQILEEVRALREEIRGGVKWHVLSLNPLDLPPVCDDLKGTPVYSKNVLNENGFPVWYNYTRKQFENADGESGFCVKAWCEIPVYKG